MRAVLLEHPSSIEHDTGSHPEQPARLVAIERELEAQNWCGFTRAHSPAADRQLLTAVHSRAHVAMIEGLCARGGGAVDLDTVVSERSYEAALHAAGGAARLVDLLLEGGADVVFSVHRPPGHHATANRAMGFCLFNNVAVAAQHAIAAHGLERVMIVDWDVHHGNGTNDIFHAADQVLFVSIHQSPLYPGTGGAEDVGEGGGLGYTVNLPLAPGSGDREFRSLIDEVVVPLAGAFHPQLLLISAGYDAHREDPLAECLVTEEGYAAMTRSLRHFSLERSVPLGAVLEGGYALGALSRSVAATMHALVETGRGPTPGDLAVSEERVSPAPAVAVAARRRVARWWPELG
jgi:acetoin utilization deacetylase AcuC-like enzyme